MEKTKVTKKQMYERLLELEDIKNDLEATDFIKKQITLLENKNKGRNDDEETEKIKEIVYNFLLEEDIPYTVTGILTKCDDIKNYVLKNGNHLSCPKLTSILKKMEQDGKVRNDKDKKHSHYIAI